MLSYMIIQRDVNPASSQGYCGLWRQSACQKIKNGCFKEKRVYWFSLPRMVKSKATGCLLVLVTLYVPAKATLDIVVALAVVIAAEAEAPAEAESLCLVRYYKGSCCKHCHHCYNSYYAESHRFCLYHCSLIYLLSFVISLVISYQWENPIKKRICY